MSITLRSTVDTATSQTYGYANKTAPLTSTEVDKNFITLKQKCDELATDYTTTFNADGSLKDGAVTSVSISDGSVTAAKIKDRSVEWADQRNIIYLTDTSTIVNKVEGTLNNYTANSDLTALPEGTVVYFKPVNGNTAGVTLTIKDLNTTTDDTTTLLSMLITKQKDVALDTGDLKANGVYAAFYDGTTLQLVNTLQDPTVEVKESISRVQTFGPIVWEVNALPTAGDRYDAKDSGLSDYPTSFNALLKCKVADGDYAVGDLVPISLAIDANRDPAFAVRAQETEIKVARSDDDLLLLRPSTGGTQALTVGSWDVVVRGTFQNDSTYSPAYVDRALSYPVHYPSGGVTVGDYLYVFSSPHYSFPTRNPLYKINLITNRVIFIGSTNGYQNAAMLRYEGVANNTFHASSVSVGVAGTGYTVGDVVTLATAGSTYSTLASFVVKTITGGGGTGPVGTLYDITDTLGEGQNTGTYTVVPDNPAATTGGTGSSLTLTVNWTSISTARIYWTTTGGLLYYIEPNGSNNPETVSPVSGMTTDWAFNCQAIVSGDYYGFDLANHPSKFSTIYLYDLDSKTYTGVHTSALNVFTGTLSSLESHTDKHLECIQWNPLKRRLYLAAKRSNLMHIFVWDEDGNSDLKALFTNVANVTPSYVKTIGIPGPGAHSGDNSLNSIHVDWDADTGEEKSITMSKHGVNGTVTRAAWKED